MTPALSQTARDRLASTILGRLRLSSLSGILVGLVSLVFDWVAYRADAALLSVGSVVLTVLSVVVYRWTTAGRISERGCHVAGLAIWSVAQLQTALGYAVDGNPAFTLLVILLIAGLGLVEVSRGWLILGASSALAVWLPLGFALDGVAFAVYAFALFGTVVVTLVVHEVIMGFLTDLEVLRLRDRAREGELSSALDAARHELAERLRVEEERERLREQLLHSQKLEAIGTLAGGVAHDMNNVLAAIIGLAESLREDEPGDAVRTVDGILDAARRGAALTRNLMGFSRRGMYRKTPIAVAPIIDGVAELLRRTLLKRIHIEVTGTVAHHIDADAAQIGQALINLCLNSADAMAGVGTLRLQIGEADVAEAEALALAIAPGRHVTIRVIDTGAGISPDVQARIFEPFFTTKPQGSGTGLGLAMVYGVMKGHGGAVSVTSALDHGTTMTLFLPAIAATTEPAKLPRAPRVGGTGLILVVDDDPLVRAVTSRCLVRAGYQVIHAENGQEAALVFERRRGDIGAVVLDMAMPIMGGAACFTELQLLDPKVRVVIASGYAIEKEAQTCLDRGAVAFLEKPFAQGELLDAVALALRGSSPAATRQDPERAALSAATR